MNNIGQKIKQIRVSKGISQQDLASKIARNRSMISKYETNRVVITLPVLQRIAKALKVAVSELV